MFGYKGRHVAKAQSKNMQKLLSLLLTMVLMVLGYSITAFAWFQDSLSASMQIKSGRFSARVELLKDRNAPVTQDNLLWSSGTDGILSYDGEFVVADSGETTAYLRISSYSTSTSSFQYQVALTTADGQSVLQDASQATGVLEATAQQSIAVDLPPAGETLHLQFMTAFESSQLQTAETFDQLLNATGTVYLTQDILAPDQALAFDDRYPNINLNGHTLSVGSLSVFADKNVHATMCVENGTLIVGGVEYTDADTIVVTGDGHVAVTLQNLRAQPQTTVSTTQSSAATTQVETTTQTTTAAAITNAATQAQQPPSTVPPQTTVSATQPSQTQAVASTITTQTESVIESSGASSTVMVE